MRVMKDLFSLLLCLQVGAVPCACCCDGGDGEGEHEGTDVKWWGHESQGHLLGLRRVMSYSESGE